MSDPDDDLICEDPLSHITEDVEKDMECFEIIDNDDFIIEQTEDDIYFESNIEELPPESAEVVESSLSNDAASREEVEVGVGVEEDMVMFTCSTCDIGFYSVMDHIRDCHPDQEVVVEMEEDDEMNCLDIIEHDPLSVDEPSTSSNVIVEEECVDKTGMSFTRRTLKIDKFWNVPDVINEKAAKKPVKIKKAVHNVDEGTYECKECQTIFSTNKSLRLHSRMHDPDKVMKDHYSEAAELMASEADPNETIVQFFCVVCEKSYSKEFEEIHMKSHSTKEQFNCKVCNKLFINKINLDMHMSAHQDIRSGKMLKTKKVARTPGSGYPCQYCGKEFHRPHEKVKHERIHTGEKPYSCEICGKCFRVSYCLTLHMRTHTGSRPYVCPHCKKRFKAHSVYNHHLMTHSDVRKYQCPYCPKAFKTSVQLAGHKKSHTKPFSCSECNRPFATLYAVRLHMEVHKRPNKLNFKCRLCGATYVRAFALRDHMKEQHDVEDLDDPLEEDTDAFENNLLEVKQEDEDDNTVDSFNENVVETTTVTYEDEEIVAENWFFEPA